MNYLNYFNIPINYKFYIYLLSIIITQTQSQQIHHLY